METFKICQYHWVGPRTRRAPLPCPEALAEFMVDEKAGAPKTNSKALSLKIGKIPKTGCWFQPISKWEIFPSRGENKKTFENRHHPEKDMNYSIWTNPVDIQGRFDLIVSFVEGRSLEKVEK